MLRLATGTVAETGTETEGPLWGPFLQTSLLPEQTIVSVFFPPAETLAVKERTVAATRIRDFILNRREGLRMERKICS